MTYAPSSFPSGEYKGAPRSCTKWKVFLVEGARETRKEEIVSGKVTFLWGQKRSVG